MQSNSKRYTYPPKIYFTSKLQIGNRLHYICSMEILIKKSGCEFKILAHTHAVYLAEQWMNGKLICYEVGKITVEKGFDGLSPAYFTIPGANAFGKNQFEHNYPKRFKDLAYSAYEVAKENILPPKHWEEVEGYVGEVDLRV